MTAYEYKPPFSRRVASRFRRLRGQVVNEPPGERPLFECYRLSNGRGADSAKDDSWPYEVLGPRVPARMQSPLKPILATDAIDVITFVVCLVD